MNNNLGRRIPTDWKHVEKYPFKALSITTINNVERTLRLPSWHKSHDQGSEGACVGFGTSMMMSIINENWARANSETPITHRYDCRWLWNEAKKIDEWPDTNPGDDNGTSVRAGCDVLRTEGHVLLKRNKPQPVSLKEGIIVNRWATTVDEIRSSISLQIPLSIGINWYSNFDNPEKIGTKYWIGKGNLSSIRGGHCLCLYGASDKLEAFKLKNSWGKSYPEVWIPYSTIERLIKEDGEFSLVTDR